MPYELRDVIFYVVEKLGGQVEGLKKLMKLLFLIQYDLPGRFSSNVVKYLYDDKPICRGEFYIWSYGPFMNEVYDVIEEEFIIDESEPPYIIMLPEDYKYSELPEEVGKRIDKVLSKHGKKRGWELEKLVCERLGLEESRKEEYMGVHIDLYIKKELGDLRFRELKKV
ncbi:MAG: hypothetical protein DRN15_04325 [Thermoprotei archaeon]|nr:MAG: hypothetical protein DRN15_04325 [Thermoprotei archaeon]